MKELLSVACCSGFHVLGHVREKPPLARFVTLSLAFIHWACVIWPSTVAAMLKMLAHPDGSRWCGKKKANTWGHESYLSIFILMCSAVNCGFECALIPNAVFFILILDANRMREQLAYYPFSQRLAKRLTAWLHCPSRFDLPLAFSQPPPRFSSVCIS